MKKLLSLLASIGLTAIAASSVVACGTKQKSGSIEPDEATFETKEVELSKDNPEQHIKVDTGQDLDKSNADVVVSGADKDYIDATYDETTGEVDVKINDDWDYSKPIDANVSVDFNDENEKGSSSETDTPLIIQTPTNETAKTFSLESENNIEFNQDSITSKQIEINAGTDINKATIFANVTGADSQYIETYIDQDDNNNLILEINVDDEFDWGHVIDASIQLTGNLISEPNVEKTTQTIALSSITNEKARTVSWSDVGVQLSESNKTMIETVKAGQDVDLSSPTSISITDSSGQDVSKNSNIKIDYLMNGQFSISAIDDTVFEKTQSPIFVSASFKLLSEPNLSTSIAEPLGIQTQVSSINNGIEFSSPLLDISEDSPEAETSMILGTNVNKTSLTFEGVDYPKTTNEPIAPDFTITVDKANDKLFVEATKWPFQTSSLFFIKVTYSDNGKNSYTTYLAVKTETGKTARSFIFANNSGVDGTNDNSSLTAVDLSRTSSSKQIYIASKNKGFSDIDWTTFNSKVSSNNKVIRKVNFTPYSLEDNSFGGVLNLAVDSSWQYLQDANIKLTVSFNLISDPKIVITKDLNIHIEHSEYYDWYFDNNKSMSQVIYSWFTGYTPSVSSFDFVWVGQGIDLNSVAIYDNNGYRMTPNDMKIKIMYDNDTGRQSLKIWPTKRYIDSIVNSRDEQVTVNYTVVLNSKTFPVQQQSKQISIALSDAYY